MVSWHSQCSESGRTPECSLSPHCSTPIHGHALLYMMSCIWHNMALLSPSVRAAKATVETDVCSTMLETVMLMLQPVCIECTQIATETSGRHQTCFAAVLVDHLSSSNTSNPCMSAELTCCQSPLLWCSHQTPHSPARCQT